MDTLPSQREYIAEGIYRLILKPHTLHTAHDGFMGDTVAGAWEEGRHDIEQALLFMQRVDPKKKDFELIDGPWLAL